MPREGRLEFEFAGFECQQLGAEPLAPEGIKCVDFILSRAGVVELLVEVKDPAASAHSPHQDLEHYLSHMQADGLVTSMLVPKAWGTYLHLHLTGRSPGGLRYIVFINLSELEADAAQLGALEDDLRRRLRKEMDQPWHVQYVSDAAILSKERWKELLPEFTVTELP